MSEERKAGQEELDKEKMAELADEEEMKRISELNPPSGCGRDEDRFSNK
ncbi:MAG TPA: hypothetical protein VMW83_15360 [Spirochaetia bacterium]|nr:hypothetical protein [Spirochaetia bacterium]